MQAPRRGSAYVHVHTDISTLGERIMYGIATVCLHVLIAGALLARDARHLAAFPM